MHEARPVQREYDRLAETYDRRWARYVERTVALTLEDVQPAPGMRLLDVGCGSGVLLERLRARCPGAQLHGLDLSSGMLERARQRLGDDVELAEGRAAELPWPDNSFDGVISSSMFHYLRNPVAALREWRRVVRPGGCVRVVDWCRDYWTVAALDQWLRRVEDAHFRAWRSRELAAMLREAGLPPTRIQRRRIDWFWGMMAATVHKAPA